VLGNTKTIWIGKIPFQEGLLMKTISEIVDLKTWHPNFEFHDVEILSHIKPTIEQKSCSFDIALKGGKIRKLYFRDQKTAETLHLILSLCLVTQIC